MRKRCQSLEGSGASPSHEALKYLGWQATGGRLGGGRIIRADRGLKDAGSPAAPASSGGQQQPGRGNDFNLKLNSGRGWTGALPRRSVSRGGRGSGTAGARLDQLVPSEGGGPRTRRRHDARPPPRLHRSCPRLCRDDVITPRVKSVRHVEPFKCETQTCFHRSFTFNSLATHAFY